MFGQNQTQDQSAYNQDNTPADVDTTTHDSTGSGSVAGGPHLELPGSTFPGGLTAPAPVTDNTAAPAPPASAPAAPPTPPAVPATSPAAAPVAGDPELINIKQQALQQLSPLVDHLEQTPEERFRTTMMMIQATDDQSKIKVAYEAAQAIADEKVRAQALLDVVNEINYFTQQHKS